MIHLFDVKEIDNKAVAVRLVGDRYDTNQLFEKIREVVEKDGGFIR